MRPRFLSAFYGPFREAGGLESTGDRRTYQQDASNAGVALREITLDLEEVPT